MLKAILIDDEQPNLILLDRAVQMNGQVEILGQFTDPMAALEQLEALNPDVVFVDIEMPEMNGLEFAERLLNTQQQARVVFVTAYSQYAVDAFKVNALDYLLKPVDPKELDRVVEKLIQAIRPEGERVNGGRNRLDGFLIRCLGEFSVCGQATGKPIRWITAKTEELFAYLLVRGERPVDKWELCELLWPETDEERASTNLYTTVYRLKKTLTGEEVPAQVKSGGGSYWMELDPELCDWCFFMKKTECIKTSDDDAELDHWNDLAEAERCCEGELFGTKAYQWSLAEAEDVCRRYVRLACTLAEHQEMQGNSERALELLYKAVRRFPYEETVVRRALELYGKQRQKGACVKFYQWYEQLLRAELSCAPSAELKAFYQKQMREL